MSRKKNKVYPQKQVIRPIDKKAFMEVKQNKESSSIKRWFFDRCKGAVNSIVEDVIRWFIDFILLYIVLQLL